MVLVGPAGRPGYAAAATCRYRLEILTRTGYVDLNALTEKVREDVEMANEWKAAGAETP
jgi:hypothetical protein